MVLALRFNRVRRKRGGRRDERRERRGGGGRKDRDGCKQQFVVAEGRSDERAFKVLRTSEPTSRYAKQKGLVYGDKGAELPSFLPSFLRSGCRSLLSGRVKRAWGREREREEEEVNQVRASTRRNRETYRTRVQYT